MRHFSVLQHAMSVVLDDTKPAIGLAFSEDPDDSSLVRLRVATADSDNAVEVTFDRNGRERSRRTWPTKYPAWSDKEPAVLDKELEDALAAVEADQAAAAAMAVPAGKGKAK